MQGAHAECMETSSPENCLHAEKFAKGSWLRRHGERLVLCVSMEDAHEEKEQNQQTHCVQRYAFVLKLQRYREARCKPSSWCSHLFKIARARAALINQT
jgi:hypothetical protein